VDELAQSGLNHWGVIAVEVYNESAPAHLQSAVLAPYAQSVLVVGSAGSALWSSFISDLRRNPDRLRLHQHPLDDFVERAVHRASRHLGGLESRWFYASDNAPIHLDFQRLALMSGLGSKSRLGLVIHPEFGPWMGLRSAAFLPVHVPTSGVAVNVCEGCDAPCAKACLGEAFPRGHFDVMRCADFHLDSDACSMHCAARSACPVGAEHAYPTAAQWYHSNRKVGRKMVAQELNIEDNLYSGQGPFWGPFES
jgi:hypothetical protein